MTFLELKKQAIGYPIFKLEDIFKWFSQANRRTVIFQLNQWTEKGLLERLKRGVYKLADYKIKDELILANFLYTPSYISLETALNYYGIIPDIPFTVTSVSTKKTSVFKLKKYGRFSYSHIKPALFFGFTTVIPEKNYAYNIALPEKALFDFLYLNSRSAIFIPEKFLAEARFSFDKDFRWYLLKKWRKVVPPSRKRFHETLDLLIKKYD